MSPENEENQPQHRDSTEQQDSSPPAAAEDQQPEHSPGTEKFMGVLAGLMPWVISVMFHMGLFLIMAFMVFIVIETPSMDEIIVPDAILSEDLTANVNPSKDQRKLKDTRQTERQVKRETRMDTSAGKTAKPAISVANSEDERADMGISAASTKSSFFGTRGGNAYNVVYVIDRSGSMLDTFMIVRDEMLSSIGRLSPKQTFHIILFTEGKPIENKPKKLIAATRANKKIAAKFLSQVKVGQQTNPIPALNRAFDVLKRARKKGRLIYLLTDGVFSDNEKVLREINAKNKDKKVHINTFLFGTAPVEAVNVMQRIARENGGRYTFIPFEE